jgi:hypothetical protein
VTTLAAVEECSSVCSCGGGGIGCTVPLIPQNLCRRGCASSGRGRQKRNPNLLPSLFRRHSERIATQSAGFGRTDLEERSARAQLTQCFTKMSSDDVSTSTDTEMENEVFDGSKHYFGMPDSFCTVS